jgi:putative ABC transport system substrate-binding protein
MERRRFIALLSGAASWPRVAVAQQKAIPVIGYLSAASPGPVAPFVTAFRQGLSEVGFVDAKNVTIEFRWAENQLDRLPGLATDLVNRRVDLIVTGGGPAAALAAKQATSTIPIFFIAIGDPVATGLVSSLARPGGNVTGFSILVVKLNAKRFELLSELVPGARVIGLLVNPNSSSTDRIVRDVKEAARARGVQLPVLKASKGADIEGAFASLVQLEAAALLVGSDPLFNNRREQIVALASRYAIPAMHEFRESVEIGGLVSYGPDQTYFNHQAGVYAGRILGGKKPADIPVEQPTKLELAVNLKTAKALGLTVPQSILTRADEVIE